MSVARAPAGFLSRFPLMAAGLAMAVLLAGCEAPGDGEIAVVTGVPETAADLDLEQEQAAAALTGQPKLHEGEDAPPLPPSAVRPPVKIVRYKAPEPINDDPGQVMGLADAELEDLLGEPGLLRDEPPAQVWQYGRDGCVLDVFLYAEAFKTASVYRVVYYELREKVGDDESRRRCFRDFLEDRDAG